MICAQAISLIKHFEGLGDGDKDRPGLQPYRDPIGIWTLGYGSTYGMDGRRVTGKTKSIKESGALMLLGRDILRFTNGVDRLVTVPMTEFQRGSLVSFSYNLGLGALSSSTLLKRILSLEFEDVPRQFMRWVYGGGRILPGLVRRRGEEARLFQS
jgi:lysozyme